MGPRFVLIALIAAFAIASAFATVTTIRQVKTDTSSLARPATRI
jgi:hypothetical protein